MMKLNPTWLTDPDIVRLLAACAQTDIAVRFVGGAVRDALLMREGGDVDAATPTPAEDVMARLKAQGLKVIPTGIAHGTVSVVLEHRTVEITTLRRDVETDGRHAKIAPTDSWEEDAARRDFTMNAMYLTQEGELFDPHDGASDALAGRVRFIGDATTRIAEDGLRILRFFRFFASHGEPPVDEAALVACAAAKGMITGLSGERVAAEMKKLLAAAQPVPALRLMQQAGVAEEVFGGAVDVATLLRLTMLEHTAACRVSVWARAASLLRDQRSGVRGQDWIAARWKLSRKEAAHVQALCVAEALGPESPRHAHTRVMRLKGAAFYRDVLLLSAARGGAWDFAEWVARSHTFVPPVFPVTGADLKARGVAAGPEMGAVLARLEAVWEESEYVMGKQELLEKY